MTDYATVPAFFEATAARCEERPAFYEERGGTWHASSWAEYRRRARAFAAGLVRAGLGKGDVVCIMAPNQPGWGVACLGAQLIGAVPCGLYPNASAEAAAQIARHAKAKLLVFGDAALAQNTEHAPFPDAPIVVMDGAAPEGATSLEDFSIEGDASLDEKVLALSEQVEPSDLATLIYTSGTTGEPKGVMLTHANLARTMPAALATIGGASERDRLVSYLPLSHVAEQQFSLYLPAWSGASIYYCPDITQVRDALAKARPTIFLGVPRVWEKLRAAIEARLAEATGIKGQIAAWAQRTARSAIAARIAAGSDGSDPGALARIADRLFGAKLRAALGLDAVRVALVGAAPLGIETVGFFLGCGIIIREIYGQSETSGPTTTNWLEPGKTKLASAGLPLNGVEIKLDPDDAEVLVRGPNVFAGYYLEPEATAATFDDDGWMRSGDIGSLDEDGFLYIVDRKKDLIVTAGGKNVAPQPIEVKIAAIEGIEHAAVLGDREKYLIALLTVDVERAQRMAAEHNWPEDAATLPADPSFIAYLDRRIDQINAGLERYETIKRFAVLERPFSVEGEELTPTQKVRRRQVAAKYADRVRALYDEAP